MGALKQARLGDVAENPKDEHGCNGCPHGVKGPFTAGSATVFVNGKPAIRETDSGIHTACCGPNTYTAKGCSGTVTYNGLGAHRVSDATTHCGGTGECKQGSSNVLVG